MADSVYNNLKEQLLKATIDFDTDTFKVMLLDSDYTIDVDTHDMIDDVSADEISGAGYTAGGATVSGLAVTQDNTDNEGVFDANDISWVTATFTARYAVLYKDTGTPSTSPLVCVWDFGTDKSASGGTFQLTFAAEGVLNVN